MIGLFATYFVVAFLLIPSGLFRSCYSLFLPSIIKFQRTRFEEFTFAVLAAILPFSIALALSWTICVQPFGVPGKSSSERKQAYRTVITAAINDKALEGVEQQAAYWSAANQVIRRQARLLFWYYLLVFVEALTYARLSAKYGLWRATLTGWRRWLYLLIADKILLPAVTEWHLLLTPFYYPHESQKQVWVDVLTTLDVLYKGRVNSYFLDKEGGLSGIVLESPRRFDYQGLIRDKEQKAPKRDNESYWKDIPSNNLYIPSDKITNLNVRYMTAEEVIALRTSAQLRNEGLPLEVEAIQQCRCTSTLHGHGTPCNATATENDQMCKSCHDAAAKEFSGTQHSGDSQDVPPGSPRSLNGFKQLSSLEPSPIAFSVLP